MSSVLSEPPVTVVGIGADGWDGLVPASREALAAAEAVIGGPRQLNLLPAAVTAERIAWPSPLRPSVPGLFAAQAGRRVAVLASGDPMFFGIGRTLSEELGAERLRVLPHPPPSPTPARGSAGRWRRPAPSAWSGGTPPPWSARSSTGSGCWC